MSTFLNDEVRKILEEEKTVKILASVDKNGIPHAVIKQSLHADNEGNLVFYEILESSRNNKNLVRSIWFDKKVAVSLLGADKTCFEIIARPRKSVTAGKAFEKAYRALRDAKGDVDLAAIWYLEPLEVRNETFFVRQSEEEGKYPILKHLDRLVKRDYGKEGYEK